MYSWSTALLIPAANNGSAMVRVISVSTSERTLLKGFTGSVADLAFAHLNSPQLACLDEAGNLFVWRLALVNGKIQYPFLPVGGGTEEGWAELGCHASSFTYLALNTLLREEILVHIRQPEGTPLNHFRRIIWCPFIPEESEDCCEESSPTVALLHEDRVRGLAWRGGAREAIVWGWAAHSPLCAFQAEVWDLDMLRSSHSTWPVDVSQIKQGFIVVKGHSTVSL